MAKNFILSSASAHKVANIIWFLHTSNTFRESLVLFLQMWAGSFILIRSNVYWETLVYFVSSPFAASRCNDMFLAIMMKCLDISTLGVSSTSSKGYYCQYAHISAHRPWLPLLNCNMIVVLFSNQYDPQISTKYLKFIKYCLIDF